MADDDVCPICLEALSDDHVHTLECSHSFHSSCLIRTMRAGQMRCPCCRNGLEIIENLPSLSVTERAKYLRRVVARRRDAPPALLRQVEALRKAEQRVLHYKRADSEHRRSNRQVYKSGDTLRRKQWSARRKVFRLRYLVGIFDCPGYSLPNVSSVFGQ